MIQEKTLNPLKNLLRRHFPINFPIEWLLQNSHWVIKHDRQFITFSRNEAHPDFDIPFSPNPQDVYSSLNNFLSTPDGGATPYKAVFSLIHELITDDQKTNDFASYAIVFISDGRPTDYCPDLIGQSATCEKPDLNALIVDFKSLIGSLERTTFNAIYYGEHDPFAAETLQKISLFGNGQFIDTNESSRDIHLDTSINVLISCK